MDGVVEAMMEQHSFVFSRSEHSCDSHQIRVEAYNEVGSNTSEHIEVVLPAGVCNSVQHVHVDTCLVIRYKGALGAGLHVHINKCFLFFH